MTTTPIKTFVSVTRAQLRMLRRAVRGERLPVARFRRENPTIAALDRKVLFYVEKMFDHEPVWRPTELGQRVAATRNGVLNLNHDSRSDHLYAMRLATDAAPLGRGIEIRDGAIVSGHHRAMAAARTPLDPPKVRGKANASPPRRPR